jgi:acetylornithine deacetylase/succinyl-diaminopimelate desuccinylase-like protein
VPDHAFVVDLTRDLIQLDTTNPPGQEHIAVDLIERILDEAGISSSRYENARGRPNLVARLKGQGNAPPFLMQGHVDVVTTVNQEWAHKPFGGEIVGGYLWGRGALDMKGGVAMMVSALLQAHANGGAPGDLVLVVLADEEAGGNQGAKWLVEHHPELFAGIKHGIGESGGVVQHLGGRRFYPIMVSEKRGCQVLATLRGPGGHGSIPTHGGAMARLGALLTKLDSAHLPVHITPPVKLLLEGMRDALEEPWRGRMAALLDPMKTDATLAEIGPMGRNLDAALHNTVNATIVSGGLKINVIPSEVQVQLDGRLLPGFGPDDMIRELRAAVGEHPNVGDIRGMGMFMALELVYDQRTKQPLEEPNLMGWLSDQFKRRGLICRADDRLDPVIQLAPPLNIPQGEADQVVAIVADVIHALGRKMGTQPTMQAVAAPLAIAVGG